MEPRMELGARRRVTRTRVSRYPTWTTSTPSAFEAVTRQMVDTLSDELREIRQRVDGLLWMMGGAILLDIGMRLVGR